MRLEGTKGPVSCEMEIRWLLISTFFAEGWSPQLRVRQQPDLVPTMVHDSIIL